MLCGNGRLFTCYLRSSQRSELQQLCIIADSASDQLKACSDILFCTRSRTSESSLIFPTLTLVRAILLQAVNNRSHQDFQIQQRILLGLF